MIGESRYDPSDQYRLDPSELIRIFHEEIVPEELSAATAQRRPWAILLGGQPGIGKSSNKRRLTRRGSGRRFDGVDVGTDVFRVYHPMYEELRRTDTGRAAELTDLDARDWLRMAVDYAIEQRYNVVYDSTLSRPLAARAAADRFRAERYGVEVAMVAGPAALSRLGILMRYQSQVEDRGAGHLTADASHDQGYAGILETADLIDEERVADRCRVYRRSGSLLYQNRLDSQGQWRLAAATRLAIERERSRPWSQWETDQFYRLIDELRVRMGAEWEPQLRGVEDSASELLFPPGRLDRLLRVPANARTFELIREIAMLERTLGRGGRGESLPESHQQATLDREDQFPQQS